MSLAYFIWIFVAIFLWARHKIVHHNEPNSVSGPPEQTFLGALAWPFHLLLHIMDVFGGN